MLTLTRSIISSTHAIHQIHRMKESLEIQLSQERMDKGSSLEEHQRQVIQLKLHIATLSNHNLNTPTKTSTKESIHGNNDDGKDSSSNNTASSDDNEIKELTENDSTPLTVTETKALKSELTSALNEAEALKCVVGKLEQEVNGAREALDESEQVCRLYEEEVVRLGGLEEDLERLKVGGSGGFGDDGG